MIFLSPELTSRTLACYQKSHTGAAHCLVQCKKKQSQQPNEVVMAVLWDLCVKTAYDKSVMPLTPLTRGCLEGRSLDL